MANLSITNVCNKKCVYCFANDTRDEFGETYMTDETYNEALDYIERSDLEQARLLGGEPTLHPKFINFVQRALDRKLDILLFSNGLISDQILSFLADIPENKLSVLLNTIHPDETNPAGMKRQQEVMEKLGKRVIPGVNIYSSAQELEYLIDYVNKHQLNNEIRLGISHSVLSQNNVYLHPKMYQEIGHNIVMLKMEAQKHKIALGFDCGFVPCMFPEDHLDLLSKELEKAGTCCHPIIDMLTDGNFISCYPLNNLLKVEMHDQLKVEDLNHSFEEVLSPYKQVGIYPHCTSCKLFNTRCNGGCMSFRIQRFLN